MQTDPRTVAREISGILELICPQLTSGIVTHFNSAVERVPVDVLPQSLLSESALQRALLFELGNVVGEQILLNRKVNWSDCFAGAVRRQQVFFDAVLPEKLESCDRRLARIVGQNLALALRNLEATYREPLVIRPAIPGLEWIASGHGDFAIGDTLIETKCSSRRFSSADYRQIAIYWALSYSASIEGKGREWRRFILLNPRRGESVAMDFDKFLSVVSGGLTKVSVLQIFQTLIGSRKAR